MYYVSSAALGLVSASILYLIKRNTERIKLNNYHIHLTKAENWMEVFPSMILKHMDLHKISTLPSLSLVCKKFNKCCKDPLSIKKRKPISLF